MSRNQNSHFSLNPSVDVSRSRFDRSSSVKFTFNAGDLIPFFVDEVLPGDTFNISTHKLCRMQTLITPVMDDMFLDTYYFFVPNRLIWSHWQEFMGENNSSPWIQSTVYSVPQVLNLRESSAGIFSGFPVGSIADYMGIPVNIKNEFTVSALPFRAYALIWNEWFRDENLQAPQYISVGDATFNADKSMEGTPNQAQAGLSPLKVGKFRDYFTSCLPSPQKGPDVLLPLGTEAPVYTRSDVVPDLNLDNTLRFYQPSGLSTGAKQLFATPSQNHLGDYEVYVNNQAYSGSTEFSPAVPANLWTDLSLASAASVNELRMAFQIQKLYEKDARGGTRYIEILKNHFGVTSPDSRLQRPEYLGGNRLSINVNQVVQNSGTTDTSPQGHTAAYSLSVDSNDDFTHSFVEHGFLIGVCCVRYNHTYQNGLERFWNRKNRFDYYWPVLANIGEQPVYNREIFLNGNSEDDLVFGYNEAWADYRYKPSRVAGEMRSGIDRSLDMWHLADDYSKTPHLGSSWIQEDLSNVDRVLAVTSSVSNQFFCDFYVQNYCTRPMPLYSIPGLIDHH
ncbi:VP1 [Gokushovirus WZ-2015a]|nr:VP1 [Gokushovirus WZ-2015a]